MRKRAANEDLSDMEIMSYYGVKETTCKMVRPFRINVGGKLHIK